MSAFGMWMMAPGDLEKFNATLAGAIADLRAMETKHGQPFVLVLEVNGDGMAQFHVRPADPSIGARRLPIRSATDGET